MRRFSVARPEPREGEFDARLLAARIRLAIASRNIQQQEAATQARVNQATMSRAIHGGMVSVPSLYRLCAWLGCEPGEFARNGKDQQS